MELNSEAAESAAHTLKWQAELLAGMRSPLTRPATPVPRQWTAWLLMDKAGMPRALIASHHGVSETAVGRSVWIATAMMALVPFYAAQIEAMAECMPRFQQVKGKAVGGR